jgi:hypothetical protein
VTLLNVLDVDGLSQTLTVTDSGSRLLLVAHAGQTRGVTHTLGKLHVYVALSQRTQGPMVFGTSRLQSIVRVGDHVRVRDGEEVFVLQFQSRCGSAARYAIGVEELWQGPPSTKR